ncbi:MAG: hypothetical protein V3V01_18890 [Acidimicrobiales bacterium]
MVERPPYRIPLLASRPFTRLRRLLGRHRTLWRIASGLIAIYLAFSLPTAHSSTPEILVAAEATPARPVPEGVVGVAIPLTVTLPRLEQGDLVHAVVVTDPLIVGEIRPTEVVLRDAVVIDLDESAVTISVPEESVVTIVDALVNGTVVLVLAG